MNPYDKDSPPRIAMLGAFPPQAQGVQDYCREIGEALGQHADFHAIGFKAMYPARLFPGVKTAQDASKAPMHAPRLTLEHTLAWYWPPGWVVAAFRARCDVFHAQWWSLPLWPVTMVFLLVMTLRRIPIVVTVHNVLPHEDGKNYLRLSKIVCRFARRVIVHSEANREQLIRHYGLPEARTARVPIGAYMADAPRVASEDARGRLGLPTDRRYILTFGTIRKYKGIDDLIAAFGQIAATHPDVDLIIAGKPWIDWTPFAEAIAACGLEDRVHTVLDYIPEEDIPHYFGAADLIALPYTHFDSQSGVGAVALPYRKPLLVSRVGSLPDWVGGEADWIVPPGDSDALAARLADFFANAPAQTAAFAPIADQVLTEFSWDNIAQRHLGLYRAALREAHGGSPGDGSHGS